MQSKLIVISLIIYTSSLYATELNTFHDYGGLPPEIQRKIIFLATNNPAVTKPKEATQITIHLAQTNKDTNAIINEPKFTHNLIHNLAHKYHCTHESIAKFLSVDQSKNSPKQSQQQLARQYELKQLCCSEEDTDLRAALRELITQGVNLEFTYNCSHAPKTPLMLAMDYDNNMFTYLLEHSADLNGCNLHGATALHLAVSEPINEYYLKKLTTSPAIAINQQNSRGETALLYCLTHRKELRADRLLTCAVKHLLEAGTNPEISCQRKKGFITPLLAAQKLQSASMVRMITEAIEAKNLHSTTLLKAF